MRDIPLLNISASFHWRGFDRSAILRRRATRVTYSGRAVLKGDNDSATATIAKPPMPIQNVGR